MTTSHYRPGAAGTAGARYRVTVPRPRSGDEEGAGKPPETDQATEKRETTTDAR